MGDLPGHPFRGNQYTVQRYGSSYGPRWRVLDPLGKKVRHLRNIDSEGAAKAIAESVTKRMHDVGTELTSGHAPWDEESKQREAAVREALGLTIRPEPPPVRDSPETEALKKASHAQMMAAYRAGDAEYALKHAKQGSEKHYEERLAEAEEKLAAATKAREAADAAESARGNRVSEHLQGIYGKAAEGAAKSAAETRAAQDLVPGAVRSESKRPRTKKRTR